jgi:hypothetical protein
MLTFEKETLLSSMQREISGKDSNGFSSRFRYLSFRNSEKDIKILDNLLELRSRCSSSMHWLNSPGKIVRIFS